MGILTFRRAAEADVPAIVAMLADDFLAANRETLAAQDLAPYLTAFREIDADPNQFLCVAEDGGKIVATCQLTYTRGLSNRGGLHGVIEAVRVSGDLRGQGLGRQLIEWAIAQCRARGCAVVQLTTNKQRTDAHRFYDRLGFTQSHFGYKMKL